MTHLGSAALHLHSTWSDGRNSVADILDHLETQSDVDVVAITDHDEIGAFEDAQRWQREHPHARVQPLWGCEITVQRFKHILAFIFEPPYPTERFAAFRPLEETLERVAAAHGLVVIAHPDTFWVGVGLRRLEAFVDRYPVIAGVEAYNPYCRSAPNIKAFAQRHNLALFGGSDAHFMEHLLKFVVQFPGRTPADVRQALLDRTTTVVTGPPAPKVPVKELLAQQVQALVVHPTRKARRALGRVEGSRH
jgi:predicted metal-dependent phosphoesterase TrpH